MGRYSGSPSQRGSSISKPQQPHEIWRGIGCLMIFVIPAISIAGGIETVNLALENKWKIPFELRGFPVLPDIVYKSTGLMTIFGPLTKVNNLYAYIVASIIFLLVISSVISLIYAVVYRIANPNRYGPLDAPPSKVRVKKKSR
jgi:hypothetical protein